MKIKFDDINEKIDEIMDVLDRTYWTIEIPNHPTKIQRLISRLFFKVDFKIKTKKSACFKYGDIWIDENGNIYMIKNDNYKISKNDSLLDIPMNNDKQKTCWIIDDEATKRYNKCVYKLHDIRDNNY